LTKATTSSKSPSPKTSSLSPALMGLFFGLGAGVLVCLAAWLSPLAATDRPTLALFAVALSLPLGCAISREPASARDAGGLGLAAVIAALGLAAVVSLLEPALFIRTASWCVAAGLIGVCLGAIGRGPGVVATCIWLFLNGLPFFYERMPILESTLEAWALQGCPWLGFSADAFGGDPLRRPVLYLGQWTGLSGSTGMGTLQASTLWLAAVPAFASLIVASIRRQREQTEDSAVLERAGA
jgi:hypothetical protein